MAPHYRVVQWSTGHVGLHALRGIIEHPDLELVGLIVHSDDKAGRDAAELCGLDTPTGVLATTDVDEALADGPDAVCYTATGDLRPHEAVDDMCGVLRRGIDVVSTSVVTLVHPESADRGAVERLEAACREGGASFFTSGIDPGFANDVVPLTLAKVCRRIDRVRVMEILNYATYDQPEVLFHTMGFGQPLDASPLLLLPGILEMAWGGTVHLLADGLGLTLDAVTATHERATFDRPVEVAGETVEPGTQAGLRFEVVGMVAGEPRIVVEHVTRLHDDVAPDWPPQGDGQGRYRVEIDGDPNIACDLVLEGTDGDHNTGGLVATAMRVLNAIPAVCEAPPGLLTALDV
jgi:4-hydroxy-tetrahydrodipicolinate reductase